MTGVLIGRGNDITAVCVRVRVRVCVCAHTEETPGKDTQQEGCCLSASQEERSRQAQHWAR